MNSNQVVYDNLGRIFPDSVKHGHATKIFEKSLTDPNPMKALSSKSFTKKNIFFTSIMWSEDLILKEKLAIIASANFDEPLLKKLDTFFVFIDKNETTKLAHKENFYSPVAPHDSMNDLFYQYGGSYFINDNVSSKHVGESIFKYLVDSNGKVSTKNIGNNSNSSVTTSPSVTTDSTEEFPVLGDKKPNANLKIWGKQKPCLLKRVKALPREEQDIALGPSSLDLTSLLKFQGLLKFIATIKDDGLTEEFEILRELFNRKG